MPVLTIPDGNWVCAVDEPSNIVDLPGVGGGCFPDVTQCAMQCTVYDCSGFNLKSDARKCEIYSHNPTRLALVPGCQYRQVCSVTSEKVGVGNAMLFLCVSVCPGNANRNVMPWKISLKFYVWTAYGHG